MKTRKSKIAAVSIGVTVMLLVCGAGTAVYQGSQKEDTQVVYKETTVEQGNLVVGITESGSVSIGTVSQTFDLDTTATDSASTATSASVSENAGGGQTAQSDSQSSSDTTALEVEEVYVTVGQKVNTGDKLLKLTDDSIAAYRETLEDAVTTASLAVEEAQLSAKTKQHQADYTYNSSVAAGSVAQSEYDATIATLQAAVDEAQTAVDESAAKVADYQARLAAGEDVGSELAKEQTTLASCQAKLTLAQNNYTTKSVEAKSTYEEAMLNYQNASGQRSVDTNGITDDVEDAKDTLSDAQDALEDFNNAVGDGVLYAAYAGTIMSMDYEAGDTVTAQATVATFSDDTAVTMEVSVSQEDISEVAIGDEVQIALTAYEDEAFTGTVTGIDTTTSSDNSTVSYTVTVNFTGDVSKVYADMTGEVTFVTKEVDDVLYISNKAVILDGTTSYVDVKNEDGTIERKKVTTGFSNGVNVEVTDGLSAGETVLIESQVSGS